MQNKTKKILINILKITIAFLSFFFIFLKLKEYNEQNVLFTFNGYVNYVFFIIVIILMLVNWSVEAVKWQYLISDFEKVNFRTSMKAVFTGISISIFTPNRVGELAGRVFVLRKENRTKGVFATIVGSMSQMMITVILGVVFGVLFLFFYDDKINNISFEILLFIKIISIASLVFGLYVFFNLQILVKILNKFNFSKKTVNAFSILTSYKKAKLFNLLVVSFLRYFVFLFQFYLLLKVFDVNISFFNAIFGIILTYFFSSLIPTFTFAEIGIRGTAAIFFIGFFSDNIVGIISATALLWIINLAIPAIIGSVIFSRTKIL